MQIINFFFKKKIEEPLTLLIYIYIYIYIYNSQSSVNAIHSCYLLIFNFKQSDARGHMQLKLLVIPNLDKF